jgi:hypothetical protein
MKFIETNKVILALVFIVIVICLISSVKTYTYKTYMGREGFSDYIDLEKFNDQSQLNTIETGVENIKAQLKDGRDMSKYALKSEMKPQPICRVQDAIDKDNYISKTLATKDTCPVPPDYDASKYILKSAAEKPQSCPTCPTLDTSKYVLKSTLPVSQKCPDCKCPKVSVTAGLCKSAPKCPPCPAPSRCPEVKCPEIKPCPPPAPCPACPAPVACPPKICPPCSVPEEKPCPTCCAQSNPEKKLTEKDLKHTTSYSTPNATVSNSPIQNIPTKSSMTNPTASPTTSQTVNTTDTILAQESSTNEDDLVVNSSSNVNKTQQNGWLSSFFANNQTLKTPSPTLNPININGVAGSTTLSGSLEDQSKADNGANHSNFIRTTDAPLVQTYNVQNEKQKQRKCNGVEFNHEFKQFGVYGRNDNGFATYNS